MLERRSALAGARPYISAVLTIAESRNFSLAQFAALDAEFERKLSAAVGSLPERVGMAVTNGERTVMRIGPAQFWIISPATDDLASSLSSSVAVTHLSHSRTRIAIEGPPVRAILAKLMPLDFHASVFVPGTFAMTGLHHAPVTVHCLSEKRFELYVMRTFAMNAWEWIADAALEFC